MEWNATAWASFRSEATAFITYSGIMCVTGILGNTTILLKYPIKGNIRKTGLSVKTLALLDLISCLCIPYTVMFELNLVQNVVACKVMEFVRHYFLASGVLMLVLVAGERYIAVCFPHITLTTRKFGLIIAFIQVVSIFLTTPLLFVANLNKNRNPGTLKYFDMHVSTCYIDYDVYILSMASALMYLIAFFGSAILMSGMYVLALRRLTNQMSRKNKIGVKPVTKTIRAKNGRECTISNTKNKAQTNDSNSKGELNGCHPHTIEDARNPKLTNTYNSGGIKHNEETSVSKEHYTPTKIVNSSNRVTEQGAYNGQGNEKRATNEYMEAYSSMTGTDSGNQGMAHDNGPLTDIDSAFSEINHAASQPLKGVKLAFIQTTYESEQLPGSVGTFTDNAYRSKRLRNKPGFKAAVCKRDPLHEREDCSKNFAIARNLTNSKMQPACTTSTMIGPIPHGSHRPTGLQADGNAVAKSPQLSGSSARGKSASDSTHYSNESMGIFGLFRGFARRSTIKDKPNKNDKEKQANACSDMGESCDTVQAIDKDKEVVIVKSKTLTRSFRILMMFFIITIVFLLSWSPYWFFRFGLLYYRPILNYLFFISNCTNIFVYIALNKTFRDVLLCRYN